MKIHLEGSESDGRIEILPLMDVIFCILTFFILAALQLNHQQAININLPKAQSGQPQLKPSRMIVTVDMIGQTYIDTQAVGRDQLLTSLRAFIKENPKGVVVLNAAKTASYNDVIQVLDLLRTVGGDRVALATSPGSPEPSSKAPTAGTTGVNVTPGITTPSGFSIPGQGSAPTGITPPILPQIPGTTATNPPAVNNPVPPVPPGVPAAGRTP